MIFRVEKRGKFLFAERLFGKRASLSKRFQCTQSKVICLKSLKKTRSGTSVACLSLFQLVVLSRITFFGIECFILSSF